MKQTILFENVEDDIIIATPIWSIEMIEDCDRWQQQWVEHLEPIGRRVDCVLILDDFHIAPRIGNEWGERLRGVGDRSLSDRS